MAPKPSTKPAKTTRTAKAKAPPKSRAEISTARARAREAAIVAEEKAIDALLDAMAAGKSLARACELDGMPSRSTFLRRVAADKELQARYAAAMQARADVLAEETLEIADDDSQDTILGENGPRANTEWIARSKLRVAARQWFIAKVAPKKYGDKLDVDHGVQEGNPLLTLLAKMGGSTLPLAPNTPDTLDDEGE